MAVFLNRLIPKTMLNERNKLWKDMNSIYVSFKAWKTIIYCIYAYIVFYESIETCLRMIPGEVMMMVISGEKGKAMKWEERFAKSYKCI